MSICMDVAVRIVTFQEVKKNAKFFLLKFFLYNTLKSLFPFFETLYGLQAAMKTNLSSNGLPYMVFLHKISVKSPIE